MGTCVRVLIESVSTMWYFLFLYDQKTFVVVLCYGVVVVALSSVCRPNSFCAINSSRQILLNFEYLLYCNPTRFQTRGTKVQLSILV